MDLLPIQENRSLGFALRFLPTYAGANVGHPSCCLGLGYAREYRKDLEARVGLCLVSEVRAHRLAINSAPTRRKRRDAGA